MTPPQGTMVSRGLASAAAAIIAEARRALTDLKLSDAEAVHGFRKALKRWRALMRLLEGPLGNRARRMRKEARDLMHALAAPRDIQSALDALNDLSKGEVFLSGQLLSDIRKRLTQLRDAAEATGFNQSMRKRLLRYLDGAALSLNRCSLDMVEFNDIAYGLLISYQRARKLVPSNWTDADAAHLHDLRRRVVEFRYQLDVIEQMRRRLPKAWIINSQRLRNRLGVCQDLAVLSRFTKPDQPLAPWRSHLKPAIKARRRWHLKKADRLSAKIFEKKSKSLQRRILALSPR